MDFYLELLIVDLKVTKRKYELQKMIKRVAPDTQPQSFQRDNISGGNVAYVNVGANQLNKPNLLRFLVSE